MRYMRNCNNTQKSTQIKVVSKLLEHPVCVCVYVRMRVNIQHVTFFHICYEYDIFAYLGLKIKGQNKFWIFCKNILQ